MSLARTPSVLGATMPLLLRSLVFALVHIGGAVALIALSEPTTLVIASTTGGG
jgi:hypothetical protein